MLLGFGFFQSLPNKISSALLLAFHFLEGVNVPFRPNNYKSCIRCQKLCKACFRRHMECAVLKRFLKVQGTFSIKKFLAIPLFHLKKLNLIRFIKTLYKNLFPSSGSLRLPPSPRRRLINSNYIAFFGNKHVCDNLILHNLDFTTM